MTLVELLITMVLLLVAVTVATDGLFNLGRSSAAAQLHTFSQQQNRVGMERLTYLLRQATYAPDATDANRDSNPIITHADPKGVTFTSRGGGQPTVYRYKVAINGTDLQITRYSCSGTPCVWTEVATNTLMRNVQTSTSGPCAAKANMTDGNSDADHPFRFYVTNSSTASLLPQNVDAGLNSSKNSPPGTAIDDATLRHIDTVQITLFTQETGAGISNTCESLSARVNLRNLIWIA